MNLSPWRAPASLVAIGGLALTTVLVGAPAGSASNATRPVPGKDSAYRQINLVSDQVGEAQVTDRNLVNPWGLSFSPTSPLWVADNETDVSTLYSGGVHGGTQTVLPLVVDIPGGAPTGTVQNPGTQFVIHGSDGSEGPAVFMFVGETGHLTGWNPNVPAGDPPSTEAQDAVVTPGAVYKGLAIDTDANDPHLYAADFSARTVDVYDGSFRRVITEGNFEDARIPAGFAPFNVAVLQGKVYVAYAKQNEEGDDEEAGRGLGRVDVFDLNGTLLRRMRGHGQLNAPWGLAIAPEGFGTFSGDLLVGNFGDGTIHAFDPDKLTFKGTLRSSDGRRIEIEGLWALLPGNGTEAGTDEVIFSAGPDDEEHGLLGTLSVAG